MPDGEHGERLATLEQQMRDALHDLGELNLEVNIGRPGRPSLRRRMHVVENEAQAARLLREAQSRERKHRLTHREKLAVFLLSAWMAVVPTVDLYLRLRG